MDNFQIIQLVVTLLSSLFIGGGVFSGVIYMWKRMQTSQNETVKNGNLLINKVIENSEKRLDKEHNERMNQDLRKHEEQMSVNKEHIKALQEMGKNFATALEKVGDRAGDGHVMVSQKIDSLANQCLIVKSTVVNIENHLTTRWNEMENEWGKTRGVIRDCEEIKKLQSKK